MRKKIVKENEVPVNSASSGEIAGIGGTSSDPPVSKKKGRYSRRGKTMVSEEKTQELLIRLDERTRTIKSDFELFRAEIAELRGSIKEESDKYVTKEQFAPIQRAVYTVITFICMSIVGAVVSLVIQKVP